MSNSFQKILDLIQNHPFISSISIDVAADMYTQKSLENREKISLSRVLKMGSFAALRTFLLRYYFPWLDSKFPGNEFKSVMLKILFDQVVASPIIVSLFFSYTSLFEGQLRELPRKIKAVPSIVFTGE